LMNTGEIVRWRFRPAVTLTVVGIMDADLMMLSARVEAGELVRREIAEGVRVTLVEVIGAAVGDCIVAEIAAGFFVISSVVNRSASSIIVVTAIGAGVRMTDTPVVTVAEGRPAVTGILAGAAPIRIGTVRSYVPTAPSSSVTVRRKTQSAIRTSPPAACRSRPSHWR
jgi:hypothetical protein